MSHILEAGSLKPGHVVVWGDRLALVKRVRLSNSGGCYSVDITADVDGITHALTWFADDLVTVQ